MSRIHASSFLVVLVGAVPWAFAGTLTVDGPVNFPWDGGPSPTLTLQIKNPETASETVFSYQVELQLEPAPGATGMLKFATANVAATNYLFDGLSLFPPAYLGPPTTLIVDFQDAIFPPGVTIAPSGDFNLVDLTFDDSSAPAGLFNIKLVPFDTIDTDQTSWYFALGSPSETEFANDPIIEPVVVASVFVGSQAVVPEASSCVSGIIGLLMFWVVCLRRAPCGGR